MSINNNLVDVNAIKEAATAAANSATTNIYVGDHTDMSGNNGTIINNSTVNGDVTNVTTVDNSVVIIKEGDTYTYNGGDKVITNYQQGEKVMLASDYQGIGLEGNSFFVNSSSGSLEIQDSRDKFVEYTVDDGGEGETVAYSYVAGTEGTIDGSDKAEAEILIGADNADNEIIAGDGSASLWGGNGGTDTLTGGEGNDEFFYAIGSGNDVVQNANSNDVINLLGISLEQISNVDVNIGQVNINFIDGGNLTVEGNSGAGFKLGEEVYTVNQSTKEWSTK